MKTHLRLARTVAVAAVFAVVVAACGGGSGDEAAPAPTTAAVQDQEPAALPINPNPDDSPAIAGTCLEGEPECNDTPFGDQEPQDLPSFDEEPGSETPQPVTGMGATVNGGLTVSEALVTDATGIIAVQGFLLDDGSGFRLCEALAESYPPQCGGASVGISGFEEVLGTPLASAQGVSWTDASVTFFGELIDGELVVDPFVAG